MPFDIIYYSSTHLPCQLLKNKFHKRRLLLQTCIYHHIVSNEPSCVAMAIGNNAAFEETSCAEDAVGINADIIMWVKQHLVWQSNSRDVEFSR